MTPFGEVWQFTRTRLDSILTGLDDRHIQWRPQSGFHCIGEYVLHVAGAEHYWARRLAPFEPTERGAKLEDCLFLSFLKDGAFPYSTEELTHDSLASALLETEQLIWPIFEAPSEDQLKMTLKSPIGDAVTGREGLMRLCQHAAYHTGQIVLIAQMAGFPDP